jgi:multidrug efflux pump subunit AcrA (membrane-fusion protein)
LGELAPSGVVSMQEVEQSRTALSQAEAQEAAAQAQLAAIATRLGETRIDSPIDGVVMSRRLDPGALVGPSSASILTVARIDTLKVLMPVRERDSAGLRIGQQAMVRLDARPGESYPAQIVRLAPGFDPVTRTLDVELHLENPEGKLRPGMYGRAALQIALHPQTLVLPEAAILGGSGSVVDLESEAEGSTLAGARPPGPGRGPASGKARFVYLVDARRRVRKRPVQLGYDGGTWIEIRDGLSDRDQVIIAGSDVVTEGMEVRPVTGVNVYSGAQPTSEPKPAGAGGRDVAH